MTKSIKAGLLVLALVAGAAAPAAAAPPELRTIHIDIHGFQFVPARVEAHVGDTIEWTNTDFAPHTASDTSGKWTTATLGKGAVGRMVVKAPGTLAYQCKFHPQMQGVIVVTGRVAPAHRPVH